MGSLPRSLLVAVAVILGLCAVAGFGMGLSSTFARHVTSADEEQTPIASVPAGVTIKDAQPLAPPPPPPPPPKPKAATTADAASSQAPAESAPGAPPAKTAPPTESAPAAPPSLTPPPPPRAPAPLPNDLPPT